jgi:hypothetical protein
MGRFYGCSPCLDGATRCDTIWIRSSIVECAFHRLGWVMNREGFTGRGKRGVRAGKPAAPASHAATVSETAGSGNATPKSDMMSDLPPTGFTHGVSSKRRGYTYDDLDPRIVTAAKAAATRIRSLIAGIAEETVRREIQIGRELLAIKARLGHGHFGPWLAAEFGWSDRQARQFMSAVRGKVPYPAARDEDIDAYMTSPLTARYP